MKLKSLHDLKYFGYVLKHKAYVFVECLKLGIPLKGLTHDMSKFSKDEWDGYVRTFISKDKSEETKKLFDYAWLHHQHINPHHWQFWLQVSGLNGGGNTVQARPMSDVFIKEMLADWRAMARNFGNDSIYEWYQENKEFMVLHSETRRTLHSLMKFEELYGRRVQ